MNKTSSQLHIWSQELLTNFQNVASANKTANARSCVDTLMFGPKSVHTTAKVGSFGSTKIGGAEKCPYNCQGWQLCMDRPKSVHRTASVGSFEWMGIFENVGGAEKCP